MQGLYALCTLLHLGNIYQTYMSVCLCMYRGKFDIRMYHSVSLWQNPDPDYVTCDTISKNCEKLKQKYNHFTTPLILQSDYDILVLLE